MADPFACDLQTGACKALLSGRGYVNAQQQAGFLNMPEWQMALADFDGDGNADPAVYHPPTGTLAIRLSSGRYDLLTLSGFLAP